MKEPFVESQKTHWENSLVENRDCNTKNRVMVKSIDKKAVVAFVVPCHFVPWDSLLLEEHPDVGPRDDEESP
jgi:hypothetical protein